MIVHHLTLALALAVAAPLAVGASAITLVPEKVQPVIADRQDFQTPDCVQLRGWIGRRVAANADNRMVKMDPDRLLEGYRKRPGRQIWDGEHIGKWLHAATLAWVNNGDSALREKLDYTAAELVKCQLDDGYLGTYVESERWTLWDVWAHKYNLIGLITYMRYTGNMGPLPACRRMADLLCATFGDQPGQRDIIPAGQHMGMAPTSVLEPMVLLYRLTGETRYLDFCKYILRAWERPNGPKIVSTLLGAKRVDKVGNGKAYEMLSCLNGALEYYRTVGDRQFLDACLNAWQDIVQHRLYLTGAASYREFFHDDFDLPNVNNVGETCVTTTWLQFNAQLLRLTGEARFAEQLEKVVLNQLFGAQCPDGSAWGYYVQMQGKKPYSSTLEGHCCLSSGPRGVALIPTFALSTDAEGIVINLYDEGAAQLRLLDGTPVAVRTRTRYPSDGGIRISLAPETQHFFTLKLRVPAWCQSPGLRVNGRQVNAEPSPDGYAAVRREWKQGDEVELVLTLEPRLVVGDHKNESRLAVLYGPLVLAADEALLKTKDCPLSAVGVSGPTLAALHFTPRPAPKPLKSWPGAEVFSINGVTCKPAGALKAGTPLSLSLVPFADAGANGSAYRIWLPYKPPRPDRNLLMDGIEVRSRKPNAGSIIDDNCETIAATFSGKRAPLDWFGVELEEPVLVNRVMFAHGKTFHDGGWFDAAAGKPRLEYQSTAKGPWMRLCEIAGYPATTAENPAGLKGGERFTCQLAKPIHVFGLRVVGKPASGDNPRQAFSSCGELQAYAPMQ
ncbi:MAG TPA: glycoside hydrolase family 127 protein [Candidatus Paceibacterota bacterium]|nr:glycoside hydrolase family 127 protein [Verrucomicrobiota bacterium]HSA12718.1 glycoside hydrolase family 127 protein [Candidatus Paceibacterota bacterium]